MPALAMKKPISCWKDLNITKAKGKTLDHFDLPSKLIVPTGHEGPAF
jgi:hypothetical protein